MATAALQSFTSLRHPAPAAIRAVQQKLPSDPLPASSLGAQPPSTSFSESSYLARAACGPVVCTSRGCRPLRTASPIEQAALASQAREQESRDLSFRQWMCYDGEVGLAGLARQSTHVGGSECRTEQAWHSAEEREQAFAHLSYPTELLSSGFRASPDSASMSGQSAAMNEGSANSTCGRILGLAMHSWKARGDMARADSLFQKALAEEPGNLTALASYASFLWEFETSQSAVLTSS